MATVNFSVPDEVKAEFDKAFGDQNKSSIVAELMRRAVRERQLQIRRSRVFRQLSSARESACVEWRGDTQGTRC
jgi:Arc/MetJ family transcription regulator